MKIIAQKRTRQGTGASRRLRNAGKAPGVIYGGGEAPQLIALDHNALWHAIKQEAFHSSVLDIELDGVPGRVFLRDVQVHPFRQQVLHVDLQRVSATEKITIEVPLHYVGAEESDAVRLERCFVDHILTEIEVSCLPDDLPERIEVDLSSAEAGQTFMLADITLPEGVELVLRGRDIDDFVLATVVVPREEEEPEEIEALEDAAEAAPAEDGEPGADESEAEDESKE
ncbi:MAG: 50S ribosomal protein L25/general stress protein Ctc [Ottowia sp.]|nr:50S ribosomal protein L25/general stress protein Ctc [Ottowia sp.]